MKKSLDCSRGAIVFANGKRYQITNDAVSFTEVNAIDLQTGRPELLRIADLSEELQDDEAANADNAPDLSAVPEPAFAEALRRKEIIDRLLVLPRLRRENVLRACEELGKSPATLYRWLCEYRNDDRATTLLPKKREGGRGRSRLKDKQEELLQLAIKKHHLTPRQRRVAATWRFLQRLCQREKVLVPHVNTVRARIEAIDPETYLRQRGQSKLARERHSPHAGHYGEATQPLSVVQIDHTQLDIMLVDEENRLPLKHPWVTIVFDVFSRMVLGFYISFDSPGAFGTGLALYRAITIKGKWLASYGIENEWPCWGFPLKIHMDNAKEFRGHVLRRACEQYGMSIAFRALKKPEFGGHIERWLDTFNQEIHELPGKRMKPRKNGDYDAAKDSAYTIADLEYHVAEYITGVYHQTFHSGIDCAPIKKWTDAIMGDGKRPPLGLPKPPSDEKRLRLDLMPFEERTIQPYGVQIEEIRYYDDAIRRYIGRTPSRLFTFRFDPRDMRSIFFWDPELSKYQEIGYSNMRHPSLSVWEIREVRRHLREIGRKEVNEDLIFATYEKLRLHQEAAEAKTKLARTRKERERALTREPKPALGPAPPIPSTSTAPRAGRPNLTLVPAQKRFGLIEPLEVDKL